MCCKILEITCWVLLGLFLVGLFVRITSLEHRIDAIHAIEQGGARAMGEIGLGGGVRKSIVHRNRQVEVVQPIFQ